MLRWRELELIVDAVERILELHPRPANEWGELIARAVVLAEDPRYRRHAGIDAREGLRNAWRRVRRRDTRVRPSIEQRLVRMVRWPREGVLSSEASEVLLALGLARRISKTDCLWAYLSIADFGWNAAGIQRAAARLDIDLEQLGFGDAAMLAAMLRFPMPRYPDARYGYRLKARTLQIVAMLEKPPR